MFLCSADSYKTENITLTLERLSFYFISLHLTTIEPKRSIHVNLFCEDKYLCVSGPWKCTYTRPVHTDFLSWQFMLSSLLLHTFSDIDRSPEQCQNWNLWCKHASCKVSTLFQPSDRHDGSVARTEHGIRLPWIKLLSSCQPLWRSLTQIWGTLFCILLTENTCPYTAICSSSIQFSSKKLNLIQGGIIFELHLPDILICKTKPVVDPVETSFVTLRKQCPLRLLHNTLRKTLMNTFCLKICNSIKLSLEVAPQWLSIDCFAYNINNLFSTCGALSYCLNLKRRET